MTGGRRAPNPGLRGRVPAFFPPVAILLIGVLSFVTVPVRRLGDSGVRLTLGIAAVTCVLLACTVMARTTWVLTRRASTHTSGHEEAAALPRPWGRTVLLGRGPVPPPWSDRVPLWIDQGLRVGVIVTGVGLVLVGNALAQLGTADAEPTPARFALPAGPMLVIALAGCVYTVMLLRARSRWGLP